MLSLHQLTCFLATYEHGSLTAAAEELGYAQPSVSEQIRGLEKSLGVQLFRRVGRGVVPTTVADTLRPARRAGAGRGRRGPARGAEREVASRPGPSGSGCSAPPGCTPAPAWSPTCCPATPGCGSS